MFVSLTLYLQVRAAIRSFKPSFNNIVNLKVVQDSHERDRVKYPHRLQEADVLHLVRFLGMSSTITTLEDFLQQKMPEGKMLPYCMHGSAKICLGGLDAFWMDALDGRDIAAFKLIEGKLMKAANRSADSKARGLTDREDAIKVKVRDDTRRNETCHHGRLILVTSRVMRLVLSSC